MTKLRVDSAYYSPPSVHGSSPARAVEWRSGRSAASRRRCSSGRSYDDATLKDKVACGALPREHEVKGAINVNAQQGVVQLRGEVPSQGLIDALVDTDGEDQGVARSRACCTRRAPRRQCTANPARD